MATITIPLGAKVVIERPDGTKESYILRGGNPVEWEDLQGNRHIGVLEKPYKSVQVIP